MDPRLTGGRYTALEPIGSGSMGVVYRAFDRELGRNVALKTLRHHDAEDLYRLKKEFRSLADLRHPNLVTLHDLFVDVHGSFLTMELLDGSDFVAHVRGDAPAGAGLSAEDHARLRLLLPQLLDGLDCLHAAGRMHRDIKPSNVMVTSDRRLVLLDFGLASQSRQGLFRDTVEGTVVGTLAYMAPEQASGLTLAPAADWFSVGATLFEALTGVLPYENRLRSLLQPAVRPRALRDLVPDTPHELDELLRDLLSESPEKRPGSEQIRDRLGLSRSRQSLIPSSSAVWEAPFVNRESEIALLDRSLQRARQGSTQTVHIVGESGIGKSALVRRFLDTITNDAGHVVFAGRCHRRESVPFKALDGLVDALSSFLLTQSRAEADSLVPASTSALVRLFPVLGRVPAILARSTTAGSIPEPRELRRRGFNELLELLERVAQTRTVVLWIDDLHWGDADSSTFFRELWRESRATHLLVLLSYRFDPASTGALLEELRRPRSDQQVEEIVVEPLSQDATRRLAGSLLTRDSGPDDLEGLIARESAGSPFLACELARHHSARLVGSTGLPVALGQIVEDRLRHLGPPARQVLELVSLARGPCAPSVMARALAASGDAGAAVQSLCSECLLRYTASGDQVSLETYHERIREVVLEGMEAATVRSCSLALATSLEAEGADPLVLVDYYRAGGEDGLAARHAATAAEQALAGLAFDQSARLFRLARELQPDAEDVWHWLKGQADALAQGGRSGEAGRYYYLAAAARPDSGPDAPVAELTRQAAEQYLRGGRVGEGLDALRAALRLVGEPYPRSPAIAIASILFNGVRTRMRGWRYALRQEQLVPRALLHRMDVCWTASVGLVWFDTFRSAAFHGRFLRMSLRAGEPTRLLRAMSTEAAFQAVRGGESARRRADEALALSKKLSAVIEDPVGRGLTEVCAAGKLYFSGEFAAAFERSQVAERILRDQCVGVAWELTNAHIFATWSLAHMGRTAELHRVLPGLLREADERGDRLEGCSLRAGIPNCMYWLAMDEPEEARRQVTDALAGWGSSEFDSAHYYAVVSRTLIDLFTGDPVRGWRRLTDAWPALRRIRMFDYQLVRCELLQLRARCAIGVLALGADAAGESGWSGPRLRRWARRAARQLAGEDFPAAKPWADALWAGLAALDGEVEAASERLIRAAQGFDAAGMVSYAASARYRLGELLPDGAGAAYRDDFDRNAVEQGLRSPVAMAAALLPTIVH